MAVVLANFGGPRSLEEVEEFLVELLSDQEVLRTPFPAWIHRLLFKRVARKRSRSVREDYALIGGRSPIFEDTESLALLLEGFEVVTFHRYLPKTHPLFLERMEQISSERITVFPCFPQFSYATTGSMALWFQRHLPSSVVERLDWIRSYPSHPLYIAAMCQVLREFLEKNHLKEEEVLLLFSAHGLPQQFIDTGDSYQRECEQSFAAICAHFPNALVQLSYQSQFGKDPWIQPYTKEVCQKISLERRHVVVIPLSFTSDHIETLYEVEHLYLPLIRASGLFAYRCPALNLREEWVEAIASLIREKSLSGHRRGGCSLLRLPGS
jgi:ferrochelatase